MKKLSMFSLFSAVMLTAGSAFAGGGNLLGGTGSSAAAGTMYGGVSAGQATTNCMIYDAAHALTGKDVEKDCSTNGWKLYGGYKLTDMFAVEGGYYSLGDAQETLNTTDADGIEYDYKADGSASGLGLSAVASLPVVDNLEVFGKVGLMKWKSEGTLTAKGTAPNGATATKSSSTELDGTSPLLGVGASYKFTDNWGVRGEYERFKRTDIGDKDRNVDLLSVGATFSTL